MLLYFFNFFWNHFSLHTSLDLVFKPATSDIREGQLRPFCLNHGVFRNFFLNDINLVCLFFALVKIDSYLLILLLVLVGLMSGSFKIY